MGLQGIGDIPADYRHRAKMVWPGPGLPLPGSYLKWYDVAVPEEQERVTGIRADARAFLRAEVEGGRLEIAGELGFAIHHLCGGGYVFLIAGTWRNVNELWETVYLGNVDMGAPLTPVQQGPHLEVICVWELGAVLHEQQAWTRYLYSAHDEDAKQAYVADQFTGEV